MTYRLRDMTEHDLEMVRAWRNHPDVRMNMYTTHEIGAEEHARWFRAAAADPRRRLLVCEDEAGQGVGVVTFSDIADGSASWAFYSGDTTRRGVGSAMERLALDYAFGELGLEKLNCEVIAFNRPVIEFHRKHGFRVEGILRRHYARDGERHDVYRLAHFRRAWLQQVRPALEAGAGARGLRVGAEHSEQVRITAEQVRAFAELSGDDNPIHRDATAARAAGFSAPLVHGMLVAAGFSRILARHLPGPGTVYVQQSLRFLAPVLHDQAITYRLRVISLIGDRAILETLVLDAAGARLLEGEAEVVMREVRS